MAPYCGRGQMMLDLRNSHEEILTYFNDFENLRPKRESLPRRRVKFGYSPYRELICTIVPLDVDVQKWII